MLVDEHLEAREFFVEIAHTRSGNLLHPGLPYKLSNADLPKGMISAPELGQHTEEILGRYAKNE